MVVSGRDRGQTVSSVPWWSVVETEDRQCPVSPGGQLTVDNMAGLEGVTLVNITIALLKLDIKS